MPSSMIFTGLVVLWLIVLVPAVARHRQEVTRPSVAVLSSRVLDRPQRRRSMEVDMQVDDRERVEAADAVIPAARSHDEEASGDGADGREWVQAPPRYRPGRGGFDAEAAALTARARYTFRQRVVLGLLIVAVASGVVAFVTVPLVWWLHGAIDVVLVGYLVYLRRQVRMEEQIRARRAARMTGGRRRPAEPDEGEPASVGEADDVGVVEDEDRDDEDRDDEDRDDEDRDDEDRDHEDRDDEDSEPDELVDVPERVTGTGEPVGPLRPAEGVAEEPALPRLQPAPLPPLPAGTTLVDADDEDVALADLNLPHRRAVGE